MQNKYKAILFFFITIGLTGCSINKTSIYNNEKVAIQLEDGKTKRAFKITFKTTLNASAKEVWEELMKYSFWTDMLNPKAILKFKTKKERIIQGAKDECKLTVNTFIPFGKHYIFWETIDSANKTIQTRENGGYVKMWDNNLKVIALTDSTSTINDQLIIWGGLLTKPTAIWAKDVLKNRHNQFKNKFNN